MTTSGTYTFDPKVQECLDEAFERAGIHPGDVEVERVISAKRSLSLMLRSELSGVINLWKVAEHIATPVLADNSLLLPTGAIDVLEASAKDQDGIETPMHVISRAEWRDLPEKTIQGRPDRFWVDRTTGIKTLYFYPSMVSPTYTLTFNTLYGIQDPGSVGNTVDVPDMWFDAVCAGLAVRLAQKWKPERLLDLQPAYMAAKKLAREVDAEKGDVVIQTRYGGDTRVGRW